MEHVQLWHLTWHCSPWSKWCLALRAFGVLHLSAQLPWPGMSRCGPYMPMQRSVKINTRNRFIWDDSTFDTWFWHMGPLNFYRKICTLNFDPSYYIYIYFDDHKETDSVNVTAPVEKTPQNEVPKRKDAQMQHRFWPSMHRCCTKSLFSNTEESHVDSSIVQ